MRRSSYRHEEITSVAVELAERHGVCGVTTAALARRLKFTEAALYRHFPGKSSILAAALQYLADRLLATMLIELAPEGATDVTQACRQLERHIRRFAANDGLLLEFLLQAATARSAELKDAGAAFLREYYARIESYFTALHDAAVTATAYPASELARLWVCQLMGGFVRSRIVDDGWIPTDQPGFTAFLAGLRPHAAAVHE
jgi:AcrR family transcriptional regulator